MSPSFTSESGLVQISHEKVIGFCSPVFLHTLNQPFSIRTIFNSNLVGVLDSIQEHITNTTVASIRVGRNRAVSRGNPQPSIGCWLDS